MAPLTRSVLAVFAFTTLLALPAGAQRAPSPVSLADELFAPVGTVLTVQIRDFVSSNRNAPGDTFLGTLLQPLVIDGWVVARQGQTVIGQVASANSAGRVKGTSNLAVELTEIVLVDGRQVPIRTQLVNNQGRQAHGEDAGAIAGGTGLGALIGAAAGDGKGAAIGAGIGAAAATIGVLSTRGPATEIYPESRMTFRLDAPLVVSTEKSRRAFLAVSPNDYERTPSARISPPSGRPHQVAYPPYPPSYPPYPPVYGPYPPGYPGYPSMVLVTPVIIEHRNHGRHR